MWSTTRVACLCLFLAVCSYRVASLEWGLQGLSSFTVPVMMWSDKQIFSSPKSQVLDTITTQDVEFAVGSLFNSATEGSKLASSFNAEKVATEVVVLFVEPEMTTDQVPHIASAFASTTGGSFSHLKDALESASSSLVMPYATVKDVSLFDELLLDASESIKDGSIFLARMSGSDLFTQLGHQSVVKTVEFGSLLDELKSADVFTNGVTDLVVVCFAKPTSGKDAAFTSHDEVIGRISDAVKTATKGNYAAMFSANMPATSSFVWTFEPSELELVHNSMFLLDDDNNTGNDTGNHTHHRKHKVNYFPGPLIEVYLIVSVLITMVFTGGCAIFSLQTPDRWEAPKVKKEMM